VAVDEIDRLEVLVADLQARIAELEADAAAVPS
jgi:hypothetical protein